jgi:hypothetical protein
MWAGDLRADIDLHVRQRDEGRGGCSGSDAFVAVVKPADFRQRHDLARAGRVDRSQFRRVLAQRQMRSRPMVVDEVGFQDPVQVLLTEDDDVIEAVAADRGLGTTRLREAAWEDSTPKYLTVWRFGGGTRAARRAMRARGSSVTAGCPCGA